MSLYFLINSYKLAEYFIRQNYARVFKDNGFDNTRFLSMLTKTDLKSLGIQMLAHREILWRKIQDIPKFIIPVCVPVSIIKSIVVYFVLKSFISEKKIDYFIHLNTPDNTLQVFLIYTVDLYTK